MATNNIQLNQFAPNSKVAGMYAYQANLPQVHNPIVSANQATPLYAGSIVTIDSTVAAPYAPSMKQAAVTDRIDGVVTYNPTVRGGFSAGDRIAIARSGDILTMVAAGAISAGVPVYFNASNQVTATATAGNSILGIAYTSATAEGDFIEVLLDFQTTAGGN